MQLSAVALAVLGALLAPPPAGADEIAKGNVLEGLFTPQPMFPQPGVTITNIEPRQPPGQRDPLYGLFTPQPQYPTPGTTAMNRVPEPADGGKNVLQNLFTPQNMFPQPGVSLMNLEPQAPYDLKKDYAHNPEAGDSAALPTKNVGAGLLSPGTAVQYGNSVPNEETSWNHFGPTVSPGYAVNNPNYTPYSITSSFHTGDLMSPGTAVQYPNATDNSPSQPRSVYPTLKQDYFESVGQRPDPPKPMILKNIGLKKLSPKPATNTESPLPGDSTKSFQAPYFHMQ